MSCLKSKFGLRLRDKGRNVKMRGCESNTCITECVNQSEVKWVGQSAKELVLVTFQGKYVIIS